LKQHNEGKGAKYTRGRRPVRMVYLENDLTESAARCREREIKSWRRRQKTSLINNFSDNVKNKQNLRRNTGSEIV
jgi:putative endonuclease